MWLGFSFFAGGDGVRIPIGCESQFLFIRRANIKMASLRKRNNKKNIVQKEVKEKCCVNVIETTWNDTYKK